MENLNIGTVKQLERSKLKLVRVIYYRITTATEYFYLIEQAYASKYDGRIDIIDTTEEKFLQAKEIGERTEEVGYIDAKNYIQNKILMMKGILWFVLNAK